MSIKRFFEAVQTGASVHEAADSSVLWKKNSSPPDYGPLAQASKEAAQIMADLGRDQMHFAEKQYNEAKPYLTAIADTQKSMMDEQLRQGQDYYNYQVETFRPVEQGLVADAQEFNTQAYQDRMSRQAALDANRAFGVTRAANERAMASMGVNPNSGKYQALAQQAQLGLAAQRAGAMTNARERATDMGWARRMDVTGLGRNLPGASTAAYGSAAGAGNAAGANFQQPGAAMQGAMQGAHGTIGQGQQMKVQGLSNVLNAQTQYAVASQNNSSEVFGTVAGGLMQWGMASDRRLKEHIVLVGRDDTLDLNIYEFTYRDDPQARRFRGVMADEVEVLYPTAVRRDEDGYARVDYTALGIEMVEV
jgi:hypothetical protein